MRRWARSPWLELVVMCAVVLVSHIGLLLIAHGAETPPNGLALASIAWIIFGFFLLSFAIAVIAVVAGIGGGVLFTPIMLAFTPVNSLIVRATGLIVAMFSGLISTGPFMRTGIGNLKLSVWCSVGYGLGAYAGAQGAVWAARHLGNGGEGMVRVVLGLIVLALAVYFLAGGAKREWPEIRHIDRFTARLGMSQAYYEDSLDRVCECRVCRAGWGLLAMTGVGLISGFFGLGAGWALVPVLNLVMGVPLKVAAACSGVLIGMGDCVAVWPYLLTGSIIPLFAAPWLVGQVLGGIVGSQVLIVVRASSIRLILIGITFFSSFGLLTKGLTTLGTIPPVSGRAHLVVLLAVMGAVTYGLFARNRKEAVAP